jgi:TP901 family phage tail tape measure protein
MDADGEGTLAVIDQIDAALQGLGDSIAAVADSAGDFSVLDDAMSQLSEMTAAAAEEAAALGDALSTVGDDAAGAAAGVETLTASLDAEAASADAVSAATDAAASSMDAAGAAAEGAAASMDGLDAAMGPLLMVGVVATMAGGQLFGMGLAGQKGEVLLRGMAGASQQDIEQLQESALQLGETMDQATAGFYQVESAGYAGTDAITVFTAASKLAEGVQSNQADTMSALTAIMHDYNAKADDATKYTDYMAEAVLRGKQSAQDFSSAIGPLASAGENVGLGFNQVAAAEATMTQINPHVAQDAQQLTSLFNFLSPTMGGVSKAAKGLGLSFNEQKYNADDLLGKLQYLSDIAGGTNTAAFVKLTGGVRGSTAAIDLLKNGAGAFKGNLDAMGHSAGTTANAFAQWEDSIPAHMDKAGAALSVFGTRLMDAIGPKVTPIIDKITTGIGTMADFILNHLDLVLPVLGGLAAIIGTVLIAAIVSFVVAAGPIIAILLGIGLVVGGVILAFTHWSQTMGLVNAALKIPAVENIMGILRDIGNYLGATFAPVWQQLVDVFNTQLKPSWDQLVKAFQPAIPFFQLLGVVLGVIVVGAIGLLIGIIGGLAVGIGYAIGGIARIFGGLVQIVSGNLQMLLGFIGFFTDLFTGHFSKLGADLGTIWQGIVTIFTGLWNVILGIFQTFVTLIGGFIYGFITTIIGFFTHLYDELVGHSIIPDMINGIISWFQSLPGKVLAFITGLISSAINQFNAWKQAAIDVIMAMIDNIVSTLQQLPDKVTGVLNDVVTIAKNILNGLVSDALNIGSNIVKNIASGITNAIGAVGAAIGNVTNFISSHLPHSPAKIGPLKDLILQGSLITDQISEGMLSNMPKLQSSLNSLTSTIALSVTPGTIAPPLASSRGGNDQAVGLLSQIAQSLAQLVQQNKNSGGGSASNVTFNSVQPGATNTQQLNQLIQALSGYQYESVARGSF